VVFHVLQGSLAKSMYSTPLRKPITISGFGL